MRLPRVGHGDTMPLHGNTVGVWSCQTLFGNSSPIICQRACVNRRIMLETNYEKIIALLDEAKVNYIIHEHEAIRTVAQVVEKLPHLAPIMVKTIAFSLKDGRIVLVAIHGKDRIDYRKVAKAVGTNRRNVRSMSPEKVLAELGYEVGSVGPFILQENVFILIDDYVSQMSAINCGSGKTTATLELSFNDLQQIAQASVHALAKE